jgi:arylsulfatase A
MHVLEGFKMNKHNTPFRAGKGLCYEGGLRIPLIVRWPGKAKTGTTCDVPVIHTDWVPTWVEVAGVEKPSAFDGISLMPLLTGKGTLAPRPLFWHFPHYTNQGSRPAGAMREGDWKLVEHYEDGRAELFDLSKDPGETTDLSMKEPNRVADMRGKLAKWRQDVGAQENAPNPEFRLDLWQQLYATVDVSTLKAKPTAAETAEALVDWRKLMDLVTAPPPKPGETKKESLSSGPQGLILLPASAATPHGQNLRYEPDPHKNTLGYWTKPADWASWEFDVKNAGTYEVRILQGAGKGCGDASVDVVVGEQKISFKTLETGHFQNFVPRAIGTIKLEAGHHTLEVRPREKKGAAVMDLRRVTLVRVS